MDGVQRAADSILASDQNKCSPHGQTMAHIVRVDVAEGPMEGVPDIVVYTADGRSARAPAMPHLVNRPGNRELRPADVHDAVKEAMKQAAQELAPLQ